MTPAEQLRTKVAQLQEELLKQNPQAATVLREIHKQIKEDPSQVTILTEEEIGVLVTGLKRQTNVEIATAAPKKAAGVKAAIKGKSEDDLLGML